MADTFKVSLVNTAWTDMSQSNIKGFLSNTGRATILLTQADSLPSASLTEGHPLEAFESLNFSMTGAERLYGRSIQLTGEVFVTPGI